MTFTWETIYDFFGIKDFVYFISSPSIQDSLFGVKVVFIFFTVFFFCVCIWFYLNSSYMQYQFLQDTTEFLAWRPYGLGEVTRRWKKLINRVRSGTESEYKLAIIEADDLLFQILDDKGYEGDSFEQMAEIAAKKTRTDFSYVLDAHRIRNAIVYDISYSLNPDVAQGVLSQYEKVIKNLALL